MNKSKLKQITGARLFLPIVCLIAVLLLNVIKTRTFLMYLSGTVSFTDTLLMLSTVLPSWLSWQWA